MSELLHRSWDATFAYPVSINNSVAALTIVSRSWAPAPRGAVAASFGNCP